MSRIPGRSAPRNCCFRARGRGSADSGRGRWARTPPAGCDRHRRGRRQRAPDRSFTLRRIRVLALWREGSAGSEPVSVSHALIERGLHLRALLSEIGAEADQIARLQLARSSTARACTMVAGQTNPPRLGPSGPRITGMSPVKSIGADGVGIVVNVRRMQSGLAAILARPRRLGADQADAGAVGVVVNLPRRRKEHLDIGGGEEVRRAVRAVENADFPIACRMTVPEISGSGLRRCGARCPRDRPDAARRRRAARGRVSAKRARG